MVIQNYGGEKNINDQVEIELQVMNEKKKEIVVKCIPLQINGKDKHLGIVHDNKRNGTETLKREIKSLLEEDCNKVTSRKYHRIGDKINCLNTMIIPRATYKLRNSALSNDEMIKLEKIASKTFRKLSKVGPTFPTALLYMPTKWAIWSIREYLIW